MTPIGRSSQISDKPEKRSRGPIRWMSPGACALPFVAYQKGGAAHRQQQQGCRFRDGGNGRGEMGGGQEDVVGIGKIGIEIGVVVLQGPGVEAVVVALAQAVVDDRRRVESEIGGGPGLAVAAGEPVPEGGGV